jgi:hypothetical protein
MFGFQCVVKNKKGWLKFCISYVAYSQIWLNIPMNDRHFV